jgi:NAD(P)-dependent dehydrogenase (short-subunit alcohol dehydrogenase family)
VRGKIVQISSTMGSIGSLQKHLSAADEQYAVMSRMNMAYRASKAALNMGAQQQHPPALLIDCS